MDKYTTIQGDAWDLISYKIFGTEAYMGELMRANREHIDTLIFNDGVVLNVPEIVYEEPDSVPYWRA